jgi:hypothetical protein
VEARSKSPRNGNEAAFLVPGTSFPFEERGRAGSFPGTAAELDPETSGLGRSREQQPAASHTGAASARSRGGARRLLRECGGTGRPSREDIN